jgi:hypothetical protein
MTDELKVPTIEELKRAYDEGLPQTLISGIEVLMRTPRPEVLLRSGKLPDILTPIVIKSLYEDVSKKLDAYLFTERDEVQDTLDMVAGVDAVCEAALIDPSVIPYLTLSDRMWIFKLAFMPAAVLSTFRYEPDGDVEDTPDSQGDVLPSERATGHQ